MIDYSKYNDITAKACGVHIYYDTEDDSSAPLWTTQFGHQCIWSIEDPRCREVIREHYKLTTKYTPPNIYGWVSYTDNSVRSTGKTIKDAEISCIINICDELDTK